MDNRFTVVFDGGTKYHHYSTEYRNRFENATTGWPENQYIKKLQISKKSSCIPLCSYGSFKILELNCVKKMEFPNILSSSQAELQTAIEALKYFVETYDDDCKNIELLLKGDSTTIVNLINSNTNYISPNMNLYRQYSQKFKWIRSEWHSRKCSVQILGH